MKILRKFKKNEKLVYCKSLEQHRFDFEKQVDLVKVGLRLQIDRNVFQ